ncbi:TetR family transcriptional regulator [Leifsonia sp. NPDC058194]|uniref:TetR family transcriptional regulator n=1 Tax=Leifsonia sp. NPDC058194 TaxID=3346374 RepID=UPI0036D92A99
MASPTGLRERKRERTRRVLHEQAVRLFLQRGFDDVSVAEIAEAAEVALTTLFTYYPEGKVALVFLQDEDRADALARSVGDRRAGTDVLSAVEEFMRSRLPFAGDDTHSKRVLDLIFSTPQLRAYVSRKWTDCEETVTALLVEERPDAGAAGLRALARFVLEAPDVAAREADPDVALSTIFGHLRRGWEDG